MENASKALLMGASILIAVLILSIATRFFNSASQVTKTYDSTMEQTQLSTFNSNFTKFVGAVVDNQDPNYKEIQKYATIYDVISTANFAYNHNSQMSLTPENTSEDPALVRVDLKRYNDSYTIENLQNKNRTLYNRLLQECHYINIVHPNAENIVTYEIEIKGHNDAGQINHVIFRPITSAIDSYIHE